MIRYKVMLDAESGAKEIGRVAKDRIGRWWVSLVGINVAEPARDLTHAMEFVRSHQGYQAAYLEQMGVRKNG